MGYDLEFRYVTHDCPRYPCVLPQSQLLYALLPAGAVSILYQRPALGPRHPWPTLLILRRWWQNWIASWGSSPPSTTGWAPMTSTLRGRRSSITGMTPGITENSGQPRRDHSGRDTEFEDDRGRDSFRSDGHERALYFDRAVRIPRRSTSPASTASPTPLS